MIKNLIAPVFSLFILVTLSACNSDSNLEQKRLNQALSKWQSYDLESYQITSRVSCFCANTDEVRLIVENGEIQEAYYTDSGDYLTATELSYQKTVEEHFNLIQTAILGDVAQLRIEYDETYGYPTVISVDYDEQVADDEFVYYLSNLQ